MKALLGVDRIAGLFAALAVLSGCAAHPTMMPCEVTVEVQVSPTSATVDHGAKPPGNQTQFKGLARPTAPAGCPVPEWVASTYATWSNPDPADIQISSANNSTNGTAVCKAPTNGPVTLTGTFTQGLSSPATKTVQLTCD
jgi:hypothetical protein